jgi:hypothetical protein
MKKTKVEIKPEEGISKRGKKVIGIGIFLLAIGFLVLTKTDPQGQNFASIISPFLIIGGYVTIAVGIILPDKKVTSNHL